MKNLASLTLFAMGLGVEVPVAVLGSQDTGSQNTFTIDVAVDCRTLVTGPNRGDVFIINGKIFPGGTLSSGVASNDPAQPVNGIAPVGDWLVRGHHALPLPQSVAVWYRLAPGDFATQYYMFHNARTALTAEGYAFLQGPTPTEALFSVTGGLGGFRGAAGEIQGTILGTNSTGCPNSRVKVILVPGSVRGASRE
jgi:hypothetical protein